MRRLTFALASLFVALPLSAANVPAHIAAAIAAPERSDKDHERDVREKPAELMTLAGIRPGMKVADVLGGGGYWSELIARAVGPDGAVTLVNNSPYWNYAKDDQKVRFADGRLSSITRRVVETCDLKLGRGEYDLILMFMSYHDIHWVNEAGGWPAIDTGSFLDQLHAALKPGGALLIVDNAAAAGAGSSSVNTLHRIEEAFARKDIEAHGFALEKTWDVYRNPQDDYTKLVFDAAVRGKTDRFVHLYKKQ
ncbi:MAG TPA: methyltransferase domain-containing protein [Steroidobacteraceae bacterium]|nr:methyltransferase domain-containing protein [Steroidobacteraceae bacterium]